MLYFKSDKVICSSAFGIISTLCSSLCFPIVLSKAELGVVEERH